MKTYSAKDVKITYNGEEIRGFVSAKVKYRSHQEIQLEKLLKDRMVIYTAADKDKHEVTLYLDSGKAVGIGLEGDCCSSSYFTPEGFAAFEELRGSTILGVEERSGETETAPGGDDTRAWHFLVFETSRGHVTIDWHNDSNGYYDGYIVFFKPEPLHPVAHDCACEGLYDEVPKILEAARHAISEQPPEEKP